MILALACFACVALRAEVFFTPEMIASHLKGYSEAEIDLLEKDLRVVRSVCLEGTLNSEKKFYLATAGGVGACKTTILERFVSMHPEYQMGVYLDPDPRALKFMVHTYYALGLSPLALSEVGDYGLLIRNAYNKWRGGSNYIVLSLLEEAFGLGRSIIYGTTSTGGHMESFLSKVKENGYEVILLLCFAPDEVRYDAIDYRNEMVRFYQSSPEDAVVKGILFPQRMSVYFDHADQLYLYWTDALFEKERLAAVWKKGDLEIFDREAMGKIIQKYEEDRSSLAEKGTVIPSFDQLL